MCDLKHWGFYEAKITPKVVNEIILSGELITLLLSFKKP